MGVIDLSLTLITGANGFIGQRLMDKNCIGLIRNSNVLNKNYIVGDLMKPCSLAEACRKVETIVHCAGHTHSQKVGNDYMHWQVNLEGTKNVMRAAVNAGVKNVIFLSSVKAMGEVGSDCVDESFVGKYTNVYGQSKRAAEEVVLEFGARHQIHTVCLRLAMVYGRGSKGHLSRMVRGIEKNWFPPIPDTGNKRSLACYDG